MTKSHSPKTTWKHLAVRILMLCMILASAFFTQSVSSNAASQKTKALKEYNRLLSQKKLRWSSRLKVKSSKLKFSLIYIDKNSVPELFIDGTSAGTTHVSGAYKLYTYRNGKLYDVGTYRDSFGYYKKKGVFVSKTYLHGEYETYHKLSKGADVIKLRSEKYYTAQYFDGNENRLSKAAYKKQLKKLTGKKKATAPVCSRNTAANRKRFLK